LEPINPMEEVLQVSHMKAAVLKSIGTVDALVFVQDYPVPNIKKDEVLIRIKCCSLSETDLEVREGKLLIPYEKTKYQSERAGVIIGFEISGEIYRMGKEVQESRKFMIGEEVTGMIPLDSMRGGNAEYTALHYLNIVSKPTKVSHELAAASLSSGIRAYTALSYQMKLLSGETILVCDGASSDSFMAIQLALLWGAKVFTTSTSTEHINFLKEQVPEEWRSKLSN